MLSVSRQAGLRRDNRSTPCSASSWLQPVELIESTPCRQADADRAPAAIAPQTICTTCATHLALSPARHDLHLAVL